MEAPAEVDATITRLTAHKSVQGVLILSKPTGLIIRSAGPLFASSTTAGVQPPNDLARSYAKAAVGIVESTGKEMSEVDEGEVKFLRVRMKKWEWMITPDDLYILLVVQDPTN